MIVIHAFNHGNSLLKNKLEKVLGNPLASNDDIKSLIDDLKNIGSYDYAMEKSKYYLNLAKRHLEDLRKDLADFLYSFGEFLVERNY